VPRRVEVRHDSDLPPRLSLPSSSRSSRIPRRWQPSSATRSSCSSRPTPTRGTGRVDPEAEIRAARKSVKKSGVAQKLPKGQAGAEAVTPSAADSA